MSAPFPKFDTTSREWQEFREYLEALLQIEREKNDNTRANIKAIYIAKGRISLLKDLLLLDKAKVQFGSTVSPPWSTVQL